MKPKLIPREPVYDSGYSRREAVYYSKKDDVYNSKKDDFYSSKKESDYEVSRGKDPAYDSGYGKSQRHSTSISDNAGKPPKGLIFLQY